MDRHAFAHEYQKVYRRLWLLAAGLTGDVGSADDVVQEAMVIAFKRLSEFRVGSSFSAWVSEIVRRLALSHRRKKARRKTYATDPDELDRHLQTPAHKEMTVAGGLTEIASEIDDEMYRVLNQLPEEPRACMLLRVIDGLSYAEISELVGIPEGTAMSHVHRAKSFARQRLLASEKGAGGKR